MATKSEIKRNNIRAGLFTISSLALAFAILVILNGQAVSYLFGSYNNYTLEFTLDEGVAGLTTGSDVRIGGLNRGQVTEINLTDIGKSNQGDAADHKSPTIEVKIMIDGDIELWSNAVAIRTPPVLGTNSWINIPTVGGPEKKTPSPTPSNGTLASLLPTDGTGRLPATPGDGLLTTIVGSTNAETTQTILANIEQFTGFLDGEVVDAFNQDIEPALVNTRDILAKAKNDYDGWSSNITSTFNNVNDASVKLESTMDEAFGTVKDARSAVQNIATLVSENRDRVNTIIGNIDVMASDGASVMATVRDETIVKINNVLDEGSTAVGNVSRILEVLDVEIAASIPAIRNFLQDALIAAGELKLATIEVRRSPWRLLYTPKPGELAHENLFSASRSVMLAASDMQNAAQSFQSILEQFPDAMNQDADLRADVERYLSDSLERFHQAQQRLFSIIIDEK